MSNAFRELAKQRPPSEPTHNPTGCWASNCPCRGSISLEGGHFVCSAHSAVPSDKWPRLTEKLREHDWLIAFTDDIARMDRAPEKDAPSWREFAMKFWEGQDDYCQPNPKEGALPYQLRMRSELLYRCGLSKRPAPRLPQIPKVRGNAAAFIQKEAA